MIATFVRVALILTLALFDLGFALPDVVRPISPLGDLGFSTVTNMVSHIIPNLPAARAFIQTGDSLAFPSQEERFRFYDPSSASFILSHPGEKATLSVEHNGRSRRVTLIADQFAETPNWSAPLRVLVETFWITLAVLLVWQRPSVLTWSFFLFSLFKKVAPIALAPLIFPLPLVVIHHATFELLAAISQSAAIVFILSLGRRPLPRWHMVAAIILVPLFVVLNLPASISNLAWYFAAVPHTPFDFSNSAAYGIASSVWAVVALVLLGIIYAENKGKDRQRILWVFVGFAIYSAAVTAVALLPRSAPLSVYAVLWTAYGFLPLCVTYAILQHRLIDVRFFISRGVAYGALSACVIALFALINWMFSEQLSDRRMGIFVEIVAAIVFGMWFDNIRERINRSIERTLFRRRYSADRRLRHLNWGTPQAPSEVSVRRNLVDEPLEALDLACAALFEHADHKYKLIHARGWPNDALQNLKNDDVLVLRSKSERNAYVLDELVTREHPFPKGQAKPDVVLPVFVRNELAALAFYSGHEHGEHLDSDEIRILSALAVGASTGYAQAETSRLKDKIALSQDEIRLAASEAKLLREENQRLRNGIAAR